MPTVRWTQRAQRELVRIQAYIKGFAPMACERFTERLIAAAESLAVNPLRGRPISGGRHELLVVSPYRIRYRLRGDAVEILSIWHGRRSGG